MIDYMFRLRMSVRHYECDVEGIVNNANYLHYMAHTRHKFLLSKGIIFIELHNRCIYTVVARINVQYKSTLTSDVEFESCLNVEKVGLKYVFKQDIYRLPDYKLVVRANVEAVAVINGRLGDSPELAMMLK